MKKILWLKPSNATGGLLSLTTKYIHKSGIPANQVEMVCLTANNLIRKTKTKWIADPDKKAQFEQALAAKKPEFIVIQDRAALEYITGKYTSLQLCRGGIYFWKKIPCLVLDDIFKTKSTRHGGWVMVQDLGKLKRWMNGTLRPEPKFQYTVCRTVESVAALVELASTAKAIALDIETTGTTITCIGYSLWLPDGQVKTFVVPFFDSTCESGCIWETPQDEVRVWKLVRDLHANSVPKCMQNGSYDSTYFVVYRCPLNNYIVDTLHLWHSIWAEAPKKLDFMSSIALDYYRYWKDEKADSDDDDKKGSSVPSSKAGLENYWLYNALDCHNTMGVLRFLLNLVCNPTNDWAMRNFRAEFRRQFGPCFNMSMRGVHVNRKIQRKIIDELTETHARELNGLLRMVDDAEFNPNSPDQVQNLIYGLLGAQEMPKKGKSTDETILKLIVGQSLLLDIIINQIWKVKKPANNAAKYGDKLYMPNDRLLYKMYAAGTPTGRLSSKAHDLWRGTNIQNVPKAMRVMIEPDPGFVLVEADYAQSDAYFTAFESEDEKFIKTMTSGLDTHSVHCEAFFKIPYDKIYKAAQAEEEWAVHPTKGVRQITKRVVYGSNYFMTGYTLFIQMGRDAVVAAAKFLGYPDADSWTLKQLVKLCDQMLDTYFAMYPGIKLTAMEEVMKARANGNRASCAFGYTRVFFADLLNDQKAQREFAAFFGQGGTGGNMNRSMETMFYNGVEKRGAQMLFQVHDSMVLQIPEHKLGLVSEICKEMENKVTIKGRTFVVPVDAKVGLGWGKRMMPWKPGLTLDAIKANDHKWQEKWWAQ